MLSAPTAPQDRGEVIVGTIQSQDDFRRPIGGGLLVRLRPEPAPGGWVISVVPHDDIFLSPDFVYVATPPYRGDHPRYLAPIYGHDAASVVEFSPREVRFVRTRADYERARAAVRALLWPDADYPREAARATLAEIKPRTGTLRFEITGSRLATTPDGQGRIERLEFRIEIDALH
jgi:hypothetical protein